MKLYCPVQPIQHYKIDTTYCDVYYQKLFHTYHSGYDWNGKGGGDTDYGDNIYCVYDGVVSDVAIGQGKWGLIVRIWHPGLNIFSRSAHLMEHPSNALVKEGQQVKRGQLIAHMGNAYGAWVSHLHQDFQIPGEGQTFDYWREGLDNAALSDVHKRYVDPRTLGVKFGWE
ncbi:M23 family metallopeptidase (plasmid) [Deinococcus radiomollis]|uniref:M23 family metallopeptidase n=1 Tax=Deinococcus radiomollis TaxID=468916 RepID=UPI003891B02D